MNSRKVARILGAVIALSIVLTGCSKDKVPEVIQYPSYPEQESQSAPMYDVVADGKSYTYISETSEQSRTIPNAALDSKAVNRDLEKSAVFDLSMPVSGQPAVVEISYKSNLPSYFVGVARDGSNTEAFAAIDKPLKKVTIIGEDGASSKETVGFKVIGGGDWEMKVYPLSELPVFEDQMSGTEPTAFLTTGDTQNVLVTSKTEDIEIWSYGYETRLLQSNDARTYRGHNALPGNGAVIVVDYYGEWKIEKAKEVEIVEE